MRQSEERFRTLIENGSDVILILSEMGNITYASPSTQSVMGYLPEHVIGTSGFDLVRPDDLPQVLESFGRTLQGINEPEPIEFQALHKDGTWRVLEAMSGRITEGSGTVSVVVNCREITQRKQAEETIRHVAYHDSLTGLPNRALLEDRLAIALARAQRSGQTLAVIFLEVEVTETAAMSSPERVSQALGALKSMGVRPVIDDFGTGYSSLSHLKQLPVVKLKIDKSFTHDVTSDQGDAAIASATIAMAHALNFTVTAEGVEEQEQLDFYRLQGCDEAQGYLFAKPGPPEEITRMIEESRLKSASRVDFATHDMIALSSQQA